MKKLIIATSILFAFSSAFAQEGKPSKKTPMSSKAPTSVSKETKPNNMKPNVKPSVKPVGKTSTKPAPVVSKVSPVKGIKAVAPSSNRAASSTVNTNRPEKATNNRAAASSSVNTSKAEKATNNRAASSSSVNTSKAEKATNNRAAASSSVNTSKAEKATNNRAASSSSVNTSKAEKATNNRAAASSSVNTSKAEKATNNRTYTKGEKGEVSEKDERKPAASTMNNENGSKADADYCKGWKEGYMKAFSKATGEKISSADVPNCVAQGNCEGYKCGYAAGVKNAERRIK